ncbi:site-specific integrase [Dechloromonas sp. ZS-1]|uniref:site-specific integrase n=1 Tax=Dechloromonas sp. ZS-1 TaxID=3138067 RepID=UPI0031FE3A13
MSKLPSPLRTAHAIVDVPIEGRLGIALPILLLAAGEVSVFAASYLRNMLFRGVEPATLAKVVKSIGLFYDYYVLEKNAPTLDERGMARLVAQFYEARLKGCLGLGWSPVKQTTANNDLRHITDFSSFCATNFGHVEANPSEEVLLRQLSGPLLHLWMARAAARKQWDLLFHAYEATEEGRGKIQVSAFSPKKRRGKGGAAVKYFPPDQVLNFISHAHTVRDRMCWLLLFFGGVRISELMHIYTRDISLNKDDGTARVVLAHPQEGEIDWVDARGTRRRSSRAAFLLDKYNRIPRNDLPVRHPLHAGWKGMLLEDPRRAESEVYWIDPSIGRLFWELHREYMRTVRLRVGDEHPYYFVSQRGENFGEPLKLSGLTKQFYRCAGRADIPVPSPGAHPHGGRHFYGYYAASWLKLSKERVQKMMHHSNVASTEVYYALDSAVVRSELAQAHQRMTESMPAFLQNKQLLLSDESGADE